MFCNSLTAIFFLGQTQRKAKATYHTHPCIIACVKTCHTKNCPCSPPDSGFSGRECTSWTSSQRTTCGLHLFSGAGLACEFLDNSTNSGGAMQTTASSFGTFSEDSKSTMPRPDTARHSPHSSPVANIIGGRLFKEKLIFLSGFLAGRFYFLDRHALLKE